MTLPVSGGVPEPAECELEAIAALLQSAENYRAATWAGPSYANVARWLFERGVRIQEVGSALPEGPVKEGSRRWEELRCRVEAELRDCLDAKQSTHDASVYVLREALRGNL